MRARASWTKVYAREGADFFFFLNRQVLMYVYSSVGPFLCGEKVPLSVNVLYTKPSLILMKYFPYFNDLTYGG